MKCHLRNPSSSRLLRMSYLLKNLPKKSFQIVKKIMLVHLRKMALKTMLSPIKVVNLLILALQMKCGLRKSSTTSTHHVLSHAQKLHICLTFVGTLLLSLSQSPPKLMRHFWSLSGFKLCKRNYMLNNVWELVKRPDPRKHNIIGTKWIYHNKQNENGQVVRNKARLVAQGIRTSRGN